MIISVSHTCGHDSTHVVYGTKEQLARQKVNLAETRCPDCFHAKVLRLYASGREPLPRMDIERRRSPGRGR